MLRVLLAGGVRAEVNGTAVDDHRLGGRQGRRLLAQMAWERRPVHRDELADGIWSGSLPRTWERTLSGVVTRLRVGLAEVGVDGEVITYSAGRYTLVGGDELEVDVHRATADLAVAEQLARRGDFEQARALVESVLDVARQPLMPGEDAGWADIARARHRALLFRALDLLADTALAARWYQLGEDIAREAVHWGPLREAGHQRLVRVLSAKGDRAAALMAYSACRRLLADELGVDPSPDTEAIYLELLGTEPIITGRAALVDATPTSGMRKPFPPALQDHVTTLIGRDAELIWLWSMWRRARPEAPLTAVVHGPAGSGKTSLIAVFAREVYSTGAVVVYSSRCTETESKPTEDRAPILAVIDDTEPNTTTAVPSGAALVIRLASTGAADGRCDAELLVVPLDREAVNALLEDRLARPVCAAELDEMCDVTGGWPGAIETELVARATARSRMLSVDAATAAATLATANHELADEFLRRQSRPRPGTRMASAPYKGLLRFEAEDADLFFGREQIVSDLLVRLATTRLAVVVGASGSGKSSLLRAGLIAELRRGALDGSRQWPIVLFTPGCNPSAALAACLSAATAASATTELDRLVDSCTTGPPSVIVVDQFEELFTLGVSSAERDEFVTALLRSTDDGRDSRLVLGLRSDFYGVCSALPALADVLGQSQIIVSQPSDLELRRMISLPARANGVVLEAGFVDEIVADIRGSPGGLPLMSTALLETWGYSDGGIITTDAYRAAGGVRAAIATLAEGVWDGLDADAKRIARRLLLRLATTDETGRVIGTAVPVSELREFDRATADVLGRFVTRRLVTVDEVDARIAHEALLREWPRIQGWLAENRSSQDVLSHLRRAAADWEQRGEDPADLYRGTRLAAALDLDAVLDDVGDFELSARERTFLTAGAAQHTGEVDALRRTNRRQRVLSSGLVALLVVASIAAATAVARQRQATDRARVAVAQRLVQQTASATGLDLRLLLGIEARRLDDSPEARGALLSQLTQANPVIAFLRGGGANLSATAMSPDGSTLATGSGDGTVALWRLADHKLIATTPLLDGRVDVLALSADGELAAGGDNGEIARWPTPTAEPIHFQAHVHRVLALAYGPNHTLLTAGDDGLMRAFALGSGDPVWSRSVPTGAVAATFNVSGSTYTQIRPDGTMSFVDVGTGHGERPTIAPSDDPATAVALAADGRVVAVGTRSGAVHLFDRDTGVTVDLGRLASPDDASNTLGGIDALDFTSSGDVLATAGGAVARLNSANSDNTDPLQLVAGRVTGLAVDPTGQTAVAVTETGEAVLFALRHPGLGQPLANAGQPVTALGAVGGRIVAAGDGQISVWDTASNDRRAIPAPGHPVNALAVSADGALAAILGSKVVLNGTVTSIYAVIDVPSGRILVEHDWYPNTVAATAIALHPSGTLLAIGDHQGGQVRLFEASTGHPVRDIDSPAAAVAALAYTPTGDELVGVTANGSVVRWNEQGDPIGEPIQTGSTANAVAIAADGNRIAVATASGAIIANLQTGEIAAPLRSPFGRIESVAFGLDGSILATGGAGHVQLWDVATQRPLGNPLPAPGNTTVAFDAGGRHLITGADDGEVVLWPVDPDQWTATACQLAGRTLTPDEWRFYLGDRAYHPACG